MPKPSYYSTNPIKTWSSCIPTKFLFLLLLTFRREKTVMAENPGQSQRNWNRNPRVQLVWERISTAKQEQKKRHPCMLQQRVWILWFRCNKVLRLLGHTVIVFAFHALILLQTIGQSIKSFFIQVKLDDGRLVIPNSHMYQKSTLFGCLWSTKNRRGRLQICHSKCYRKHLYDWFKKI